MSKWEKGVMTAKGNALLTKLHSGTTLSLTRAVTGAGAVTADELRNLTAIPDERQTLAFSTKSHPEEGQVAVPLRLTNSNVTEEYKITCVGIYAMDPDEGEILYTVAKTAVNEEITVPTPADNPSFTYVWTFYVKYGQADSVTITVDPSAAVTVEEMQVVLAEHSENTNNPHGVTAEQLGLGNVENTRDSEKYVAFASESGVARKIKNNLVIRVQGGRSEGTDLFTYDGSAGKSINLTPEKLGVAPAIESKSYPGCFYRTVDDETEWINPPMISGVAYRTTERRDGKPVKTLFLQENIDAGITRQKPLNEYGSKMWIESVWFATAGKLLPAYIGNSPFSLEFTTRDDGTPCLKAKNITGATATLILHIKYIE